MDSPPILPVTSIWHSFVASFGPLDNLIVSRHTIDSREKPSALLCSQTHNNFSRRLKATRERRRDKHTSFVFVVIVRFYRTDDKSKIMSNKFSYQTCWSKIEFRPIRNCSPAKEIAIYRVSSPAVSAVLEKFY